jgi:hypothetical protein
VADSTAFATECRIEPHLADFQSYKRNQADSLVGVVHTHPTAAGQAVYGCPDRLIPDPSGTVDTLRYERWPGDTINGRQPAPIAGEQRAAGGGSPPDWEMLQGLVNGYVVNADGEVWQLPTSVQTDPVQRVSNMKFTQYIHNMLAACDW